MCGGDGGGGEFVGVRLRFKGLYNVKEVDTVTPVQYMQFNVKTLQSPLNSP